ncbi:MAG: putative Glycerophosphoryl diester phosphodiesterase family protein [Promethearchaeota archaeon]|jgi:glycerophosphoryl diester phosphodiesterase|nr:MAG: putative Glycerophosphoryl diester phosphodiesterase family protein [Candidatus Lokiarchaeota archaeon]
MKNPIIFGHRGASGYCVENTISSFRKAVEMNANIETDIRLTRDNVLVCFHDPGFKIKNQWYKISNITFEELRKIKFGDQRQIPHLKEVFEYFNHDCYNNLLYSFDIGSIDAGIGIIKLANEENLLPNIIITETQIKNLKKLRKYNKSVKLVHTVPHNIPKIEDNDIDFELLRDLSIKTLNIKANRYMNENFHFIIKKDFKCFIWGVNTRIRMKKILRMRENGQMVDAVYTDYPDKLNRMSSKI